MILGLYVQQGRKLARGELLNLCGKYMFRGHWYFVCTYQRSHCHVIQHPVG